MNRLPCKREILHTALITARKKKVIYIHRQSPLEAVHSVWLDIRQLQVALIQIRRLLEHKEHRNDFSPDEWDHFVDWLQQALYIEHSVKRLIHSIK